MHTECKEFMNFLLSVIILLFVLRLCLLSLPKHIVSPLFSLMAVHGICAKDSWQDSVVHFHASFCTEEVSCMNQFPAACAMSRKTRLRSA